MVSESQTPPQQNAPQKLDLDNLGATAPKVELRGSSYPLRLSNTLGLQDAARAQKLGTQFLNISTVMQDPNLSEEDQSQAIIRMREALNDFLSIVLPDMPEGDRIGMSDEQKMAILSFFTECQAQQRASLSETLARSSQLSASITESAGKNN